MGVERVVVSRDLRPSAGCPPLWVVLHRVQGASVYQVTNTSDTDIVRCGHTRMGVSARCGSRTSLVFIEMYRELNVKAPVFYGSGDGCPSIPGDEPVHAALSAQDCEWGQSKDAGVLMYGICKQGGCIQAQCVREPWREVT